MYRATWCLISQTVKFFFFWFSDPLAWTEVCDQFLCGWNKVRGYNDQNVMTIATKFVIWQ